MISRLSEMLRHDNAHTRRQGIELAVSLAGRPEMHAQILETQRGPGGFHTGVIAALMLNLPASALAVSPDRTLLLTLPFNLPELALLSTHPRPGGICIVEAESDPALSTLRFPTKLLLLSLCFLKSDALIRAVVGSGMPMLTELRLEHLSEGIDLSGLEQLTALRSLRVCSAPGVRLSALPPDLDRLELEGSVLPVSILADAGRLTDLRVVGCEIAGTLQLPAPGALRRVHLEELSLTALPAGLMLQPDLHTLKLNRNELAALPESIWTLHGIEVLHLSGNQLRSLPAAIGQLSTLRQLELNNNLLVRLPESIGALTNLETLWLRDNPLRSLPASMASMSSLKKLVVSNTALRSLPACLHELPALEQLALRGLHLSAMPPAGTFPMLRKIQVDRAMEGLVRQWSRRRIAAGLPELLIP